MSRILRFLRFSALLASLAGSLWAVAPAAPCTERAVTATPNDEYAVKAACLYNIARYTKWPAGAFDGERAPFVLGVLGTDPFGERLDATLAGKTLFGRDIVVRRFAAIEKVRDCHLLFVAEDGEKHLPELARTAHATSTLLVGDRIEAVDKGAAVALFVEQRKTRFAIQVDALKRAKLEAGSELLKLARIVRDEEERK